MNQKIAKLGERALKESLSCNNIFIFNDLLSFQLEGCVFDTVTMIDVLHHIPTETKEQFLLASMDKVAPNGHFIFKDISTDSKFCAFMNKVHDLVLARELITYTDLESVETLFLDNGFELIARKKTRLIWYLHDMMIFKKIDN